MKQIIIVFLLLLSVVTFAPWNSTLYVQASEPTIREYIQNYASLFGVSEALIVKIINCENSEWNPALQSRIVNNGIREDSWGLVQINLPSHPQISKAEATDARFSIEFLAKMLSHDKGGLWTCYRKITKL